MRTQTWMAIAIAAGLSCAAMAAADPQAFNQHYAAYQQALKNKDIKAAIHELSIAHQLAKEVYSADSENYANLTLNLANAKLAIKTTPNEVFPLYQQVVTSYEKLFGADDPRLIEALLGVSKTAADTSLTLQMLDRSISIAEHSKDPALLAEVQLEGFEIASKTNKYSYKHLNWLKDAYAFFNSDANKNANLKLRATFLLGDAKLGEKRLNEAADLLNNVVEQTKGLNYSHPFALASHARLVTVYERLGKSDAATPHCVALGAMQPWANDQDIVPLYRVEPSYPEREARRGVDGYAVLRFTINESGAVQNISVEKTSGSASFGEVASKALSKWRYTPKFVDGKPTTTDNHLVRLDFNIN